MNQLFTSEGFSISPAFIIDQVFFFLWLIYLFGGCNGSFLLLLRFFSLAVESRGYSLLQGMVLGHSGSIVVVQGAQLPTGMLNLPGPVIKPVLPALTGRFLSTAPPGSPRLGLNGKHISVEDPGQSRQTMSKVCSDYCSVLPFSTLLFSTLLSQYCQIVHFLPHSWSVVFPTSAF